MGSLPDSTPQLPSRVPAPSEVWRGLSVLSGLRHHYEPALWRKETLAQAVALVRGRRPGTRVGVPDHLRLSASCYRPRREGARLWIRHGSTDAGTWAEVNLRHVYTPPWQLPSGLRVLDLGANVGYFSRWALERWPVASLVSVEPDAGNWRVLQQNREAAANPHWRLVHAAATTYDGTVRFGGGRGAASSIEDGGADVVPSVDALRLLGECDFAKIDIEGGEWTLLADPRFVASAPPLLVLEYHPVPGLVAPAAEARGRLQAAGYEITEGPGQDFGIGMLWARREDRPAGAARAAAGHLGEQEGPSAAAKERPSVDDPRILD